MTQHSNRIQSNSKTHISAKQRYLWINYSNVCNLQDSLSELGEIGGEETIDVPENEMPAKGLVSFTNGEINETHFSDYQYSGY